MYNANFLEMTWSNSKNISEIVTDNRGDKVSHSDNSDELMTYDSDSNMYLDFFIYWLDLIDSCRCS